MSSLIPIGNPPITQEWLGIWYAPRGDEPDPASFAFIRQGELRPWHVVPPKRDLDPIAYAEMVKRGMPADARVYVLVPGRRFDRFGTRHGRGGGWYDRFLSHLPRSWMRIGATTPELLSDEPLVRQPWDEPMDRLIL